MSNEDNNEIDLSDDVSEDTASPLQSHEPDDGRQEADVAEQVVNTEQEEDRTEDLAGDRSVDAKESSDTEQESDTGDSGYVDLTYTDDDSDTKSDSAGADEEDDLLLFVPMFGFSRESLKERLDQRINYFGSAENFEIEAAKNGSFDNILHRLCMETPEVLSRAERITLSKADGPLKSVYENAQGKKIIGFAPIPRPVAKEGTEKVSGIDAILAIQNESRKGSTLRVPLMNSGFCIDLVPPSLSSLQNYMDNAIDSVRSLGRSYGGFFFAYMDYFLKQAMLKLWRSHVVGSSLKSWDKGDNLIKSVKVEDYDTIIMALASLIYPEGYPHAKYSCVNPSGTCNHIVEGTISLRDCIIHNYNKLSPDALAHIRASMRGEVTQSQIAEYQKLIPFVDGGMESDDNTITWDRFTIVMHSPSWYEYQEAGDRYLREIAANLVDENPGTIRDAFKSRALKQFTPWVSKIYAKRGENSRAEIYVPEDIENTLDYIQTEDEGGQVLNDMLDAIQKHKITHIGIPTWKCPECGHDPDTRTGYFIIDPLEAFFVICMSKLASRG